MEAISNSFLNKMKISASNKRTGRTVGSAGKDTACFLGKNEQFLGMIAVADVIKEDSPQAVKELTEYGNPCCYADRR